MVTVEPTASTSIDNIWTPPKLAVRVIKDSDIRSSRSTGLVGEIDHDLVPYSIRRAKGPVGGSCQLAWRNKWFIKAGEVNQTMDWFRDKTITVEKRVNEGDNTLQKILFRGKVSSPAPTYDPEMNGIQLYARDWWYPASFPPVIFPSRGLTLGQICQIMRDSNYIEKYIDGGALRQRVRLLYQKIFPEDSSGNPIAGIDEELLESNIVPGNMHFEGQKFGAAFAELIERSFGGSRIPVIEYEDDGFVRFSARERGQREKTIIVGSPGATSERTYTRLATVKRIQGTVDSSDIQNRAIGIGAPVRKIAPMELTPDWTEADEAAVEADPDVLETPRYEHVYRQFKAPDRFWSIASKPRGFGEDDTLNDEPTFWRKSTVPGESEGPWENYNPAWKPFRTRNDRDTAGTLIDDLGEVSPRDYSQLRIRFQSPQKAEYYTAAQRALQEADTAVESVSFAAYQIEVEAVQIMDKLEVDTGVIGEQVDGVRTMVVENSNYQKIDHRGHYNVNSDGSRSALVESPDSGMIRDDTAVFGNHLTGAVTYQSEPKQDFSVEFAIYDDDWRIGDRIVAIGNNIGETNYGNLKWDVESIDDILNQGREWKTTLQTSNMGEEFEGGFLHG